MKNRDAMPIPLVPYLYSAPLYWWKEFDTYKVGTVANSCSTMHKIADKKFETMDFSTEHLLTCGDDDSIAVDFSPYNDGSNLFSPDGYLSMLILILNKCREKFLETKDKKYWWQMIQLLPSSYNQKRTVMLNYEVLANIYKSRKNHKLDEWKEHDVTIGPINVTTNEDIEKGDYPKYTKPWKEILGFCDWIKTLPYSELICGPDFLDKQMHILKKEENKND